jgi:acyl-CoA thioester hydrolase
VTVSQPTLRKLQSDTGEDGGVTRHVVHVKPRWSDMDAYGHVNNVTWMEYLQEARVDMFHGHGDEPGGGLLAEGVVVARVLIDYKRALVFRPDPVRIEMWVSRTGTASFTLDYEALDRADDGAVTVYAVAQTILVPVTLNDGRPRRLRPSERALLAALTDGT